MITFCVSPLYCCTSYHKMCPVNYSCMQNECNLKCESQEETCCDKNNRNNKRKCVL